MNVRHEIWRRRRRAVGKTVGPIAWWAATGQRGAAVNMLGRPPILHTWGATTALGTLQFRSIQTRQLITVSTAGELVIGNGVSINQGVSIHAERSIRIGARVRIGDGAVLYDTSFHASVPGGTVRVAPIVLEDDVWIGNGALILPGVTIGRGSVVAARAVVTRSVPSGVVVAGAPAKVIQEFEVPEDFRRE